MKTSRFLKLILEPKRDYLILSTIFIFSFLLSLIQIGGLSGIIPLLKIIENPKIIYNDNFYSYIFTLLKLKSAEEFIIMLGLTLFTAFLIQGVLTIIVTYIQFYFSYKKQADLASSLLSSYLNSDYRFHINTNSATLIKNINVETGNIALFIQKLLGLVLDSVITLLFLLFIFILDWKVTSFLIVFAGIFYLFVSKVLITKTRKLGNEREEIQSNAFKHAQQALTNIKEIKITRNENYFTDIYAKSIHPIIKVGTTFNTLTVSPKAVIETVVFCGFILLCLFKFHYKSISLDFLASMGVYGVAMYKLMPAANRILAVLMDLEFFRVSVNIIGNQLVQPCKKRNISINKKNLMQEILIDNLSFRYNSYSPWLFRNLSMSIKKGDHVLIIGESGSGKSTFIDILAGILEPDSGHVLYDGENVRDIDISKIVGYLPQKVTLLDGNIINNIAFGTADDIADKKRIKNTLSKLNLPSFNEDLEKPVGEDGIKLSGGERQRIGIARVFYANKDVILLDEFSSALDRDNEINLIQEIMKVFKNNTIVAVSHNTSLSDYFDVVYRKINDSLILCS